MASAKDWSVRVRAEAFDAGVEDAVDRVGAAGDRLVDAGKAFHQLAVERACALVESAGEFGDALVEGGIDKTDGRLEAILEQAGAQVEVNDRIVGARLQALAEGGALVVECGIKLGQDVLERTGDTLFSARQAFGDFAGALGECLVKLTGAFAECRVELFGIGVERRGAGLKFTEQFTAALLQRAGQLLQAGIELAGKRDARSAERLDQVFGLAG